MRKPDITAFAIIALLAASSRAQPAPTTAAADVPVKEVVLFSSGVGYFEHFGTVRGDGSTELRFKTNQINDILKSLVLQDVDGGQVTTVTYPSQDPIAKTLKSFQVDITTNPPLADLLNQLRGAKVSIDNFGGEHIDGTILGVEKKKRLVNDHANETIEKSYLNLLSGGGNIQPVELDGIRSIKLEDPQLQEELSKALLALASARDQDKKPVRINFTGQGERHIRIGYVVETPIWKTSYRLILGEPKKQAATTTQPTLADGKLQGWAIVENQTDNDWNNVQLSLVSGRPISFIENLYTPLYIPRPVVQPELYASLRPQTYAGGMAEDKAVSDLGAITGAPAATAAPQQMAANRALRKELASRADQAQGNASLFSNITPAAPPMDPTASVATLASATNVGELFQYTVGNVSLPRQRSAMIPIITDPVEVERVSIYNASVLPRNPLNGARVKNTTQKHLLAGPITVIDGASYAGDAQIDNLPPGQERLLSYGVDLQMLVDAKDNSSDNYAGLADPGVDALIDKVIFAKGRDELTAAVHALDRVLLALHIVVPSYTNEKERIAHWDRFSHADKLPLYSIGFPDIWWYDEAKAEKTGKAQ